MSVVLGRAAERFRPWTGARSIFSALIVVFGAIARWFLLQAYRRAGTLARWSSRGWLTSAGILIALVLVLAGGPPLFDALSSLGKHIGLWQLLKVKPPTAHHWLTVWTLFGAFAGLMALRWMAQARRRVVVDDFVDYTSDAAKAVSGLSTLLVSELGRLRTLYKHVNEQLSVSRSVGVTRSGGLGTTAEPGSFLTVRADDTSEVLAGAVASEGDLQIGVFRIPIGTVLALVGRLFKGPRLLGSVHLTDAGGGPMLTAQIVGRGRSQAWRVDLSSQPGATTDRAYLEPMVAELACRMFTDLTLRGSVRWRAIDHFTRYLHLYSESRRTPKHRARYLRQAEGALLEAISEDDEFDLAYYNLGVIYGQLAETERRGAAAGELGKAAPTKRRADPDTLHKARIEAAVAAFTRALEVKPARADPMYALAVHRYAQLELGLLDPGLPSAAAASEDDLSALGAGLDRVVQLCDEVIDLDPRNAQAFDLRGLANRSRAKLADRQDDPDRSMALLRASVHDHRQAVRKAWRTLCQAEYGENAHPSTSESTLPQMRANASAALRNLAVAYHLRADLKFGTRRWTSLRRWTAFWRADFVFMQALKLAPPTTLAATQFERGVMREVWPRPAKAIKTYQAAAKLDAENPLYQAQLARVYAQAKTPSCRRLAGVHIDCALEALTPIFHRSLEPFPLRETAPLRDKTLARLADACERLGEQPRIGCIARIRALTSDLQTDDIDALDALERPESTPWERFQIRLARARLLEGRDTYDAADQAYQKLLEDKPASRAQAMMVPTLHARRAKVLRKRSRRADADERSRLLRSALEEAAAGALKNPLNPGVRREVGKEHFALEQYADALEVWEQTLALTPNDPHLNFKLGLCHWHLAQDHRAAERRREELQSAWSCFDNARLLFGLECIEEWTWSQLWRGRASLEQGDLDAAVPDLRSAANSLSSRLAALLLLGEGYRRAGEQAMSLGCFERVFEELRTTQGPAFLDDDKGDTLSRDEALAWAGWAVAVSPAAHERTNEQRLAILDLAQEAAARIPGEHSRTLWTARCWDARGQVLGEVDLEGAVRAVKQAGGLVSSPEIIVHLLELYETQAKRQRDHERRLEIIAQAERAVRQLRRLDARECAPYAADATEILARLQALSNGKERSPSARWVTVSKA